MFLPRYINRYIIFTPNSPRVISVNSGLLQCLLVPPSTNKYLCTYSSFVYNMCPSRILYIMYIIPSRIISVNSGLLQYLPPSTNICILSFVYNMCRSRILYIRILYTYRLLVSRNTVNNIDTHEARLIDLTIAQHRTGVYLKVGYSYRFRYFSTVLRGASATRVTYKNPNRTSKRCGPLYLPGGMVRVCNKVHLECTPSCRFNPDTSSTCEWV